MWARTHRGYRSRGMLGQALVEFAILAPVLTLFVLITVDLGRAFWESIDGAGAARAGVRMGIISDTADIGSAIRDEPNSGIPNSVAAWGNVGPGTAWGTCATAAGTCGDPNGCVASSFVGNSFACFAIRTCALTSGGDLGTCAAYSPWGTRPGVGGAHGLQVLIVIRFQAVTPALAQFVPGGILFLKQTAIGDELYF